MYSNAVAKSFAGRINAAYREGFSVIANWFSFASSPTVLLRILGGVNWLNFLLG